MAEYSQIKNFTVLPSKWSGKRRNCKVFPQQYNCVLVFNTCIQCTVCVHLFN